MDAAAEGFTYVDLFAGIGGFAGVLESFGGRGVYSVEIDPAAAAVYERNWGHSPLGDITKDADDGVMNVPEHDVLAAGFPCQPFSKSGAQKGMDETRGTLFFNIMEIIRRHHPTLVVLENVRNLAGPRHRHEWQVIIQRLREEGYRVSEKPAIFSPHLLPLEDAGRPQARERVFITATYDPGHVLGHTEVAPPVTHASLRSGEEWDLTKHLPIEEGPAPYSLSLTPDEVRWINAWDDFVSILRAGGTKDQEGPAKLPGFPVWVDEWTDTPDLGIDESTPAWKASILRKNAMIYTDNKAELESWYTRHRVHEFPPSRRKFEWQAQGAYSLWDCALQLRPSGIRAKRMTHLPALVAITQTPILGPLRRRLSTSEAARLQGLPREFDFGPQRDAQTYKQLGNGISIGAVWHVLKEHVANNEKVLETTPAGQRILKAITRIETLELEQRLTNALRRGQQRYADRVAEQQLR